MFNTLIAICWLFFIVVWVGLSLKAKKTIGGNERRQNPLIRVVVTIAVVILIFNMGVFKRIHHLPAIPIQQFATGNWSAYLCCWNCICDLGTNSFRSQLGYAHVIERKTRAGNDRPLSFRSPSDIYRHRCCHVRLDDCRRVHVACLVCSF